MADWYFDDFVVGERIRTMSRTITEADLAAFVGLAGFFEEVFLSVPVATERHNFKRRLVPGPMTFVIAEGLFILTGRSHRGIAYLGVESLRLTAPVGCGDTIICEVEVIATERNCNRDAGIVKCRHRVNNQDGIEVLSYQSARMIEARPLAGGEEA
jgi:acyl dehydratase